MKIVYTDVLVIGGGLAGLRLAIGAKRRGHDALILSLVPAKRSHSKAAQGGMQASLGQRDQGAGRQRGRPLRGHGARLRLGRRPGSGAHVREHGAQGGARAGGVGRAVEPRAQGRPRRHHQRPEGHHHRARRGARPDRAARLRRHQEVAHLLRRRRHGPRHDQHGGRPGHRRLDPRARAQGGPFAHPRRQPLLRRRGPRPRHRRGFGLRGDGHGRLHGRGGPRLPQHDQRRDLRGHRPRARARDRGVGAGQHGGGPVPPDGHLPGRHPRDRGLPRRRRPAQGRRRPPLHARLRAGEEGARLARRGVAPDGRAHQEGQGPQVALRRAHLARHHAARREAHPHQPAGGVGHLPLLPGRRPGEGDDPGAPGAALHDGRGAHGPHRPEPDAQGALLRGRGRLLGHARLQPAGRQLGGRDGRRRHDRGRDRRRLLRQPLQHADRADRAGARVRRARAGEARGVHQGRRHRGRLRHQGRDAGPHDRQGGHLPHRQGPRGGRGQAAEAARAQPPHRAALARSWAPTRSS